MKKTLQSFIDYTLWASLHFIPALMSPLPYVGKYCFRFARKHEHLCLDIVKTDNFSVLNVIKHKMIKKGICRTNISPISFMYCGKLYSLKGFELLDKELSFVFKGKNADFVVITPTDKMKSIVNDKLFDLYNYRLSA